MNSTPSDTFATLANYALLFVYALVFSFFAIKRYRANKARARGHHRISLGIALSSLGWVWHALLALGWVRPLPYGLARWFGVAVGIYLLHATHPRHGREAT